MSDDRRASEVLLRTAVLVPVQVESEVVIPAADEGEFGLRLALSFHDDDSPMAERTEVVQWGAFAFVYAIGLLSFADARPRGGSVRDYAEGDQFAVTDLLDTLRFRDGALRLELDYLRGRRLKTRLTVRADGTGELETVGRGKAALRWIARLRGEPPLQALG